MVDILDGWRQRRLDVVALTNTNRAHEAVWSRRFAQPLSVFTAIHCSFRLRARKPEPDAFARVLAAHGVPPGDAVFVDDVPAHVDAARGLGLHGIVFRDAAQLADDLAAVGGPSRG